MCKLLLTVDHQFVRTPDGKVWVKTIYGYDFWRRYLAVFDSVRIAARVRNEEKICEKMLLASGDKVEFFDLPQYRGSKEFALKYPQIAKQVKGVTEGCSCAIFRIPSPIANLVKKEAVKRKMPWAVEIVNDPWDNFAPGTVKSIFRPIYRIYFTLQVKKYAKGANGVSYVTQYALQKRYPSYAKLHGESKEYFESYYSSILLKKDYFSEPRKSLYEQGKLHLVHINSCITDLSKGHDVVLQIVKRLRDKGHDVEATFIGDGPMRKYFEAMAVELKVEKYIFFTGLLSNSTEVRDILLHSDILVFPTLGEGLPRTVIEAMAVGLPCLSTAVNGIPELLAENDMFEQKDVDGFVCRIEELISDNAEYQKVSGQNISKALEYENSVLEKRRKIFYARLMDLVYGLYSI